MKQTGNKSLHISVSPGLYFFLALLILLLPFRYMLAAFVSVVVHELCHLGAIRCFGNPIYAIHLGVDGARIRTPIMPIWQELICAMAGPLGGMLLLLPVRWFPVLALCAGFHTLYNLLPVYPQDGGRALRCAAHLMLPERCAKFVCTIMEYTCLTGISILGFYGTFILKTGIFPVLFAILFLWRSHKMKNSLQRD